uniref:BPTI/Kunitz inhibitor domain-containing protein n=1 Tax=Trichuris muris TaxID=70415 RepID=A0A5S6QAN2_TRIMR
MMNGPWLLLLLTLSFIGADEGKAKLRSRRNVMNPFLMAPVPLSAYQQPPLPFMSPLVHPMPPSHMCLPRRDCTAPPDIANCGQSIVRWFWNPVTSRCEVFFFGGCSTNSNNFATQEECLRHCAGKCDRCQLPADTGPCRASVNRWYFDASTGQCKQFVWGGCGGNSNNFLSREECLSACSPNVCLLPAEPGPCLAYIPRWAYNFLVGRCVMFIYGGCGGNANNFETQLQCETVCNGTRPFVL